MVKKILSKTFHQVSLLLDNINMVMILLNYNITIMNIMVLMSIKNYIGIGMLRTLNLMMKLYKDTWIVILNFLMSLKLKSNKSFDSNDYVWKSIIVHTPFKSSTSAVQLSHQSPEFIYPFLISAL